MRGKTGLRLRESFVPLFMVLIAIISLALVIDSKAEEMAAAYHVVSVGNAQDNWDEAQLEDDGMNAGEADFAVDLEAVSPILARAREKAARGQFADAVAILNDAVQKEPSNAVLLNELGVVQLRLSDTKNALVSFERSITANQRYFRAYYNRAIAYTKAGQLKNAAIDYEQAIRLRPNHFESLYNLGLLRMKQRTAAEAYHHLKNAVKSSSGDNRAAALFSLARAEAKLGRFEKAIRSYERAIEYRPDYVLPRYNLALLLAGNKDSKSRTEAERRIGEILALRPDFAPAYFVKARFATAQNRLQDAILLYETAIVYDPMFWKARYNLALLQLDAGRVAVSKQLFSEMENDFPQKAEVFFNLGRIAYGEKKYDDAEKYYKQAVTLRDGMYPEAQLNLGVVKKAKKEYEEAIAIFDSLINSSKDYSPAYLNKGLVLFRLKRYAEAKNTFEAALSHGADRVKVYYNLARLAYEQKQYEEAKDAYEKALQADATHLNSAINLGVVYGKLKNLQEAANAYSRAVAISPKNLSAQLNLAMTQRKLKRWKDASDAYRRVVELDSDNLNAWHNLGVCLAKSGDTKAAAAVFEQILEKDPASVKARYNLALQLKKQRKFAESMQQLQAVLKLDANHFQSYVSMASILLEEKKSQQAFGYLKRAKLMSPDDTDVEQLFQQYHKVAELR